MLISMKRLSYNNHYSVRFDHRTHPGPTGAEDLGRLCEIVHPLVTRGLWKLPCRRDGVTLDKISTLELLFELIPTTTELK